MEDKRFNKLVKNTLNGKLMTKENMQYAQEHNISLEEALNQRNGDDEMIEATFELPEELVNKLEASISLIENAIKHEGHNRFRTDQYTVVKLATITRTLIKAIISLNKIAKHEGHNKFRTDQYRVVELSTIPEALNKLTLEEKDCDHYPPEGSSDFDIIKDMD